MTNDIVGGVVGGVIAAAAIGVFGWVVHRIVYARAVRVRYEPTLGKRLRQIDVKHIAGEVVRLPMRLEMLRRLNMERVGFTFTDGPNRPDIVTLFDWGSGEGIDDRPLHRNVMSRTKGDTIQIGVVIFTRGLYAGALEVTPTCKERPRMPPPERVTTFVFDHQLAT